MKKALLPALLIVLLLILCACGSDGEPIMWSSADEPIMWSEGTWETPESPVDALPTIDLTIEKLQQQANEYRRSTVECTVDFDSFPRETIEADANCLSAEEVQQINVLFHETAEVRTVSVEDAQADMELFSRILRSSYGSYYLYDAAQWEAAAAQLQSYLQSYDGKEISSYTLVNEMLSAYAFVKDDHFRINHQSVLEPDGILYYCYLKDIYFWEDEQGFFTWKDDCKWYVTAVNGEAIADYIKPTITPEGELAYAVGTFLAETDPLNGTITLSRGDMSNTVGCCFTMSQKLSQKQGFSELTQAGLYDGYYVMGIRGFPVLEYAPGEEESLRKYPEMAAALNGTANFIIDSRSNGGGGDIWLEGFYENFTGVDFDLTINEIRRVSLLTNRRYDSNDVPGLYENKVDGSYASNDNLFLYLIDKGVGSAGERGIESILQMDNALLVGTNSAGCVLGGGGAYVLPHTKICVNVGDSAFIEHNCTSDIEGLGWMPDIYVDGYLALDRAIAMYKYYGLAPDENVSSLDCWGEEIRRFETGM